MYVYSIIVRYFMYSESSELEQYRVEPRNICEESHNYKF